ncbi:hypothetical protein APHAL10511_007166 [Amanita phalloides]|nr:hypothetical protein APHAL10511_007166 [Amanita phalloides]
MFSISTTEPTRTTALREGDAEQENNESKFLKVNNIFRVVEMAFELQSEKLRAIEALKARDVAVQRLADAYTLLMQKTEQLESSQSNHSNGNASTSLKHSDINYMGSAVKMLREESQALKDKASVSMPNADPAICYEVESDKNVAPAGLRPKSTSDTINDVPEIIYSTPGSDEPSEMIHARYAVLAAMPLPPDAPDDTLKPIVIPAPFTFNEFINSISGSSHCEIVSVIIVFFTVSPRSGVPNERSMGTSMHRDSNATPILAFRQRTVGANHIEFFFNKDGAWYYAGVYKVFAMDDLTTKEWASLPPETTQAIIKDTLSGRKNTSPQNVYETGQLYAVGALRVACIGLQCVGFNQVMYKSLLEHAGRFAQGKLKTLNGHSLTIENTSPRTHSCNKEMTEALGNVPLDKRT